MSLEQLEEDNNARWVNEANELIMSIMNMGATELALFQLLVSHVNPKDPNFDGTIVCKKSEIFSFFEASSSSKHTWFKKVLYNMQDQATFLLPDDEIQGEERRKIIITVKWGKLVDDVTVRFHPDVIPYLHDLSKYTKTDLRDIQKIKDKKHAIVLYRFLNMNYRQYTAYNSSGGRTQAQLENLKNPSIDEMTLRRITSSTERYKRFIDLDIKVVRDAINSITENTKFNVKYERLKNGRKPVGFKFYIDEKNIAPLPEKMKSREELEREFAEQFTKAFSSPYLMKLLGLNLLTPQDMANQELHVKLLSDVYPLYDKIRHSQDTYGVTGEELLDKHLSYVASKMYSPSESNQDKDSIPSGFGLVKYLRKSATNFINAQLTR